MARRLVNSRRTTPGRLIFGLLIACTLPGAFLGFAGALESGLLQRPHEALVGIAAFALVLLYFVLPAALCLGLPLLWLLRRLARESSRQAAVAELKLFSGLRIDEISFALNISATTVKQEWRIARAWRH